jgi:hypothetical protein
VRLRGEQKDTFTVWFTLRQRTLHYETYVMPAPEENFEQFYEHLLRRNMKLFGAAFAIGPENAVFLVGQIPVDALDEGELDRVEAIILSMTPDERANPGMINGSRRKRIANGSGTKVQNVNALVKQFDQMRKLMRSMTGGKMPNQQQLAHLAGGSPKPKIRRR